MNQEQINHENSIIEEFVSDHMAKYEKGCIEHGGGGLWTVPEDKLLDMGIEEVLDQASYLYTLKPKLHALLRFKERIGTALTDCSQEDTHSAIYLEVLDAMEQLNDKH